MLNFKTIPTKNEGSPAEQPRDRALEGLRRLMLQWPGCSSKLAKHPRIDHLSEQIATALKVFMANLCTQMFSNASGRTPILPHRLPAL